MSKITTRIFKLLFQFTMGGPRGVIKKVGQKSPTFNKSQPYKSVEDQDPLKTTPRRSLQSILELLFYQQGNSQSQNSVRATTPR